MSGTGGPIQEPSQQERLVRAAEAATGAWCSLCSALETLLRQQIKDNEERESRKTRYP